MDGVVWGAMKHLSPYRKRGMIERLWSDPAMKYKWSWRNGQALPCFSHPPTSVHALYRLSTHTSFPNKPKIIVFPCSQGGQKCVYIHTYKDKPEFWLFLQTQLYSYTHAFWSPCNSCIIEIYWAGFFLIWLTKPVTGKDQENFSILSTKWWVVLASRRPNFSVVKTDKHTQKREY